LFRKIAIKLFGGENPEAVLAKRIKIFVLIGIVLIAISKLLYLRGIMPFPNFELIIVTLVVIGSFSLYAGGNKFWRGVTRYFGIIALVSVFLIDICFWGLRKIYIFTWSGFIICWLFGMRNKLSMFDKFKKLLWRTTLTAAVAIIIFDIYTGVLGWSLMQGVGLATAFLGLIPFMLLHLCSLIFVPPLVGLGKAIAKVKVPVSVAVPVGRGVGAREHIR
jgi:hypothetical protein